MKLIQTQKRTTMMVLPALLFFSLVHCESLVGAAQKVYSPGEVELKSSSVYVHVGKTGLGHEHAVLGKLRFGNVQLGATGNAGRLVFDMSTFVADVDQARKFLRMTTDTDQATRSKVTSNMTGPHVLDVAKFPTAEFSISSTRPLPQPSKRGLAVYEFQGIFTLHGQSRPVKFAVEVEQHGSWTRLMGNFSILQTDYGITPFSTALGAIGVADRLTIYGDIWIAHANVRVDANPNASLPSRPDRVATH